MQLRQPHGDRQALFFAGALGLWHEVQPRALVEVLEHVAVARVVVVGDDQQTVRR